MTVARFIASILSSLLFAGCGTVSKTVRGVDESGDPLAGAVMHPGVTYFNDTSGKNGTLRVSSNFPVIVKDGFQPAMANLADKKYGEVVLRELPESIQNDEARKSRDRLVDESLKLSGEYTRVRLKRD